MGTLDKEMEIEEVVSITIRIKETERPWQNLRVEIGRSTAVAGCWTYLAYRLIAWMF